MGGRRHHDRRRHPDVGGRDADRQHHLSAAGADPEQSAGRLQIRLPVLGLCRLSRPAALWRRPAGRGRLDHLPVVLRRRQHYLAGPDVDLARGADDVGAAGDLEAELPVRRRVRYIAGILPSILVRAGRSRERRNRAVMTAASTNYILGGFGGPLLLALLLLVTALCAAPRAHGTQALAPRLESKGSLFELLRTVTCDRLTVYLDDVKTNEPVAGAEFEIEAGAGTRDLKETPPGGCWGPAQ